MFHVLHLLGDMRIPLTTLVLRTLDVIEVNLKFFKRYIVYVQKKIIVLQRTLVILEILFLD